MGILTNMFKSPGAINPPERPLPPPPPDLPDKAVMAAAAAQRRRSAAAAGANATILTSPLGVTNPGGAGTKSLLGT